MVSETKAIRILVADASTEVRERIVWLLKPEPDIEVVALVSTSQAALQHARDLAPDIALVDATLPGQADQLAADILADAVPFVALIVMGGDADLELLRRAMLAGARQFLIKPFNADELVDTIRQVAQVLRTEMASATSAGEEQQASQGRLIAVFSPKGGIGCTTIAVNLAIALREETRGKVALVDCSLQFGDVGVMLNLMSNSRTIIDLAPHASQLEHELEAGMLVKHSSGVEVLLAPPRPELAELVGVEQVKKILRYLQQSFDYVVVDTYASFNDMMLAVLDLCDPIVLVTALEIPAIKNTKLFLNVAQALGYPEGKIFLVLNRSDSSGGIKLKDLETHLGHGVDGTVVSDGQLVTYAANHGTPFVLAHPGRPVSQNIRGLAARLAGGSGLDVAGKDETSPRRMAGLLRAVFR